MKVYKQFMSWVLLAVLALAITPFESFHHHEEHSLACTEEGSHIEQKAFECELADFVLPIFTETSNKSTFNVYSVNAKYLDNNSLVEQDLRLKSLKLRGPPRKSFLS